MIIGPRSSNAGEELPLTDAQREHANSLDFESLKAYLTQLQIEHLGLTPDPLHADVWHSPEPKSAQTLSRTITIGGKQFTVEGADERELDRRELEAHQAAETQPVTTQEQPRGADGKFKAAESDAARQQRVLDGVELERKFRLSEISASDYIQQSGALAEALEKELGMPLDEVKETFQERQGKRYERDWADATNRFLTSDAGSDWPGGNQNMKKIGEIISNATMEDGTPLVDAPDKVAALEWAYSYAKEHELLVENPELEAHKKLATATSRQEIDSILGRDTRQIWGAR